MTKPPDPIGGASHDQMAKQPLPADPRYAGMNACPREYIFENGLGPTGRIVDYAPGVLQQPAPHRL
jgi:hypothetical protein